MECKDELLYWIWLAEGCGAGSRLGVALLRKFGSIQKICRQKPESVARWDFLNESDKKVAVALLRNKSLEEAGRIFDKCTQLGIQILCYEDAAYPDALRVLQNAPLLLYYKGRFPRIDEQLTTAVVGTRTMSEYGRNMAYRLGYGLAAGGSLIVSGMALGIDRVAMMGALDAGGTTLAVLGCGVDIVYPKEHTKVYKRILDTGGCILSEYAPGTEPKGCHFPVRNRIISGLSDAGVVVEGKAGSGSLITARHLIYQGRKLFAVPGQVGLPGSEGPNDLIRNGALPAVTAEDILCEFVYMFPDSVKVHVTHTVCRNLDVEKAAQDTMQKTGVRARKDNNFVGEGTYGGRSSSTPRPMPVQDAPMPMEDWVYPATAKAVWNAGTQEASAEAEKAVPETIQQPKADRQPHENRQEAEPVKRPSVLEILGRTLPDVQSVIPQRKYTADPVEKAPGKAGKAGKQTPAEKSSQKDTEKIQPAQKLETELLDETEMRVYNSMKPNVPVMPDELVTAGGFTIGQVMAAMTSLEMAGVIEAGSGGYFLRTDPDDMPVTLVDDSELEEHGVKP